LFPGFGLLVGPGFVFHARSLPRSRQ